MAKRILKLKISVDKILKEHLYKGEKGTYADLTVFVSEEADQYGNNGMIVQDLPKTFRDANPDVKGPILGNCKWIGAAVSQTPAAAAPAAAPGAAPAATTAAFDDLPF